MPLIRSHTLHISEAARGLILRERGTRVRIINGGDDILPPLTDTVAEVVHHHPKVTAHCRTNTLLRFYTSISSSSSSTIGISPAYDNNDDHDKRRSVMRESAVRVSVRDDEDHHCHPGQALYDSYLQWQKQAEALRAEQDRNQNQQMYEAWKKAEEKQQQQQQRQQASRTTSTSASTSRFGGMAVVQTLVKHVNRDKLKSKTKTRVETDTEPCHNKSSSSSSQTNVITGTSPTTTTMEDCQKHAQSALEDAALQHGHAEALVLLGNQQLESAQSVQDLERAMELWKQSGTGVGWFNVGHLLWTGYNHNPNHNSNSNNEQQNDTTSSNTNTNGNRNDNDNTEVHITQSSVVHFPSNRSAAFQAFEQAVALDDADALYFVGVHKLSITKDGDDHDHMDDDDSSYPPSLSLSTTSTCVSEIHQQGLDYVERAAAQERGGAMYYLALLHLQNREDFSSSGSINNDEDDGDAKFQELLNRACDIGMSPDALFLRGHCYYQGDHSYPCDLQQALDDFLKAADGGNADAAVSAGAIYFHGGGGGGGDCDRNSTSRSTMIIPRDARRAFELYQHAGELGSVEGWRNVVSCYATGQGVPQSLEMAEYIARTMLQDETVSLRPN